MAKKIPPYHYRTHITPAGKAVVACMKDSGTLDRIVSDPKTVSCKACLFRMENPK